MLFRRLGIAALAAFFGLSATAATLGNAALHAPAAYADDEGDQGNGGDHDNGKHKHKHHKHHHGDSEDGNGNGNGGGYYGGGRHGGNGPNCGITGGYGLQRISGFERSGYNGSTFTLRQPLASGIPWQVGGTDYTIQVDGNTCVQRSLGTYGEHVTVVGRPLGDGHTILALRITG